MALASVSQVDHEWSECRVSLPWRRRLPACKSTQSTSWNTMQRWSMSLDRNEQTYNRPRKRVGQCRVFRKRRRRLAACPSALSRSWTTIQPSAMNFNRAMKTYSGCSCTFTLLRCRTGAVTSPIDFSSSKTSGINERSSVTCQVEKLHGPRIGLPSRS